MAIPIQILQLNNSNSQKTSCLETYATNDCGPVILFFVFLMCFVCWIFCCFCKCKKRKGNSKPSSPSFWITENMDFHTIDNDELWGDNPMDTMVKSTGGTRIFSKRRGQPIKSYLSAYSSELETIWEENEEDCSLASSFSYLAGNAR